MPKYTVYEFQRVLYVVSDIEAENEKQAQEMFLEGEFHSRQVTRTVEDSDGLTVEEQLPR